MRQCGTVVRIDSTLSFGDLVQEVLTYLRRKYVPFL